MQCDKLLSFVGFKVTPSWAWLAMEVDTQRILGCAVGRRTMTARRPCGARSATHSDSAGRFLPISGSLMLGCSR